MLLQVCLPVKLQRHLYFTRDVGLALNRAKVPCVDSGIDTPELRMVEGVESLRPEFNS